MPTHAFGTMKIAFVLAVLTTVGKCWKNFEFSGRTIRNSILDAIYDDVLSTNLSLNAETSNGYFEEPTILAPIVSPFKSEKCRNHFAGFVQDLKNFSSWAIEMYDASSKLPIGLITANTYQLGNYDQCVNVLSSKNSIRGKYCLANIEFSPHRTKYPPFYALHSDNEFSLEYNFYKSVLEKFKATKDFTKKRRNNFYSGICIPDSCGSKEAELFLYKVFESKSNEFNYNVKISVSDRLCSTKEIKELSREAKFLGFFVLGMIFCVLFCTASNHLRRPGNKSKSKIQLCVEAFSLSSNVMKFCNQRSDEDTKIFNGMKCLSMILIIMGHRCMASCGGPLFNPKFVEERYRKIQNVVLLNGTLIVDTFFLIGGYLMFLTLFKEFKCNNKLSCMKIYLHRWLRIAPVYALIIFFYGHFLEHMGNGPVWEMKVGREAERCRKNWWTNFFFVNNYVNTDSLCMFQSWYITCDMHFTLLAPFIVKCMVKSSKKGLLLLLSLIIGSLLTTFFIIYHNKYDGVLRLYITTFEDLASSFTFTTVYVKTHHRATPYFVGMVAAYIYLKLKETHHKFSMREVWVYSILAVIFALSAICGAWLFYIPGRKYNALENALYASSHRLLWALSMSWIALAGGTKAFGILEPFLSHKFFTPFSKLSYSTFLVHGAVQLYTSATLRTPEHMDFPKLYWMTCGDVMLSFGFAFFIYIFFEAPIKGIQILLLPVKKKNT